VLGANGAGKTSLLKGIAGVTRARGDIQYAGRSIVKIAGYRRPRMGIILVPEGRGILASMTVEENLQLGVAIRFRAGEARDRLAQLYDQFPLLAERRRQAAGLLSGGEQQQLAIARGIASRPGLLLLDEPSLGLAPKMIDDIFERIAQLNADDTTILLVEQNARKALQLVSHAYIMESGQIVAEGSPSDLAENDAISRAYLGG
jgi:branched-chain amino acid transport system ATP-binding protein